MAVTPESNLALIEELQELVGAKTYEPVDGPEFSYPAVGQAVDDEMWQWVTRAIGDGVIDLGDRPYGLSGFNNSNNTAVLTVGTKSETAHAILGGFYHRLTKNMTLSFPMPTTETTYYVTLELNPLKARTPEGPISVQVYPNDLNTESGRRHIILHSVTRRPNELLTDADTGRVRQRVAPVMVFGSHDQLPDLDAPNAPVLWGAVALVHGIRKDILVAKGDGDEGVTRWESIVSPPWNDLVLSSGYEALDDDNRPQWRLIGDMIEYHGQIKRTNGAAFTSGDYVKFGRISGPAFMRATYAPAVGTGARSAFVSGTNDGRDVSYYIRESGATWLSIDCRIPVRFE